LRESIRETKKISDKKGGKEKSPSKKGAKARKSDAKQSKKDAKGNRTGLQTGKSGKSEQSKARKSDEQSKARKSDAKQSKKDAKGKRTSGILSVTTGKSGKSGKSGQSEPSSLRAGKTKKAVETESKAKKPMSEADRMRLQYYDANPVPAHSIGIFYNRSEAIRGPGKPNDLPGSCFAKMKNTKSRTRYYTDF